MSSFCAWTRAERLTAVEWLKRLTGVMLDTYRPASERLTAAAFGNTLSQAIVDDIDLPEWAKVAPNPRLDSLQHLLGLVQQ